MTVLLRRALPRHSTPTTDVNWDGAIMAASCPADAASLRAMHAWQDAGRSASDRSNYKLPHHMASQDGAIGEANTIACRDGIAALNDGSAGIPDADLTDVYDHLAGHVLDAGADVPELNSRRSHRALERRRVPASEIRMTTEGGITKITGHAATFNQLSSPINDFWETFRERIAPGAFTKTLLEADIPALWNHNADFPLARNKAGTLTLREDAIGLYYEFPPPDTSYGRDLVENIRTGNVTGNSFGFVCVRDRWDDQLDAVGNHEQVRTVLEAQLWDISPVTYPAYPQTDIGMRAGLRGAGVDWDAVDLILAQRSRGRALSRGDRSLLSSTIDALRSCLPAEPGQPTHSDGQSPTETTRTGPSIAQLRRRLDLLAVSN